MKCNLLRFILPVTVFAVSALAQTGTASPAAPAPSEAVSPSKIGIIDLQAAIIATNEGRRDFDALQKKFEPKQSELQKLNQDIEDLKKQLQTQGDKLNDDSRNGLVRSIEDKQKTLQRNSEDAQNDFQQQRDEIAGRILQKMGPVLDKYAKSNNFAVILDASQPWPQGQVVWAAAPVNVTEEIVNEYNSQSGVAAPAASPGAPSAPSASRSSGSSAPATPTPRPAGPASSKPAAK